MSDIEARPRCAGCKHWSKHPLEMNAGQCCCLPPQMLPIGNGQLMPVFPITNPDNFCGQFAAREDGMQASCEEKSGAKAGLVLVEHGSKSKN